MTTEQMIVKMVLQIENEVKKHIDRYAVSQLFPWTCLECGLFYEFFLNLSIPKGEKDVDIDRLEIQITFWKIINK